ncbi:hypothetical protein, partial [Thiolapillus sp.]|uniref:hypothetical protein n=1 Tax=Thiolapillus sp. TaxID=2017437 RepID=UPI003AF9B59E
MSIDPAVPLLKVGYSKPANGCINRLQWTHFAETIPKLCGKTLADIPLIKDSAYVRELLQYAVMDDLRGPANGPNELIKDMSVCDRYLVGKLAPRETLDEGNDWGNSAVDEAEDVVPDDLEVKAKPAPPTAGKRTKAGEQPKDEEALGKGEPETSDE